MYSRIFRPDLPSGFPVNPHIGNIENIGNIEKTDAAAVDVFEYAAYLAEKRLKAKHSNCLYAFTVKLFGLL